MRVCRLKIKKAIWKKGIKHKIIAVTLGDPTGIGPEIIKKSIKNLYVNNPLVIIGTREFYLIEDEIVINRLEEVQRKGIFFYDIKSKNITGDLSYAYVNTAVKLALSRKISAIVTGPVSKEKWITAGVKYKGHTELLAETAGIEQYSMFFWSKDLKVILYTIHQPLKTIFPLIKKERIKKFLHFTDIQLQKLFKKKFKYIICGLNPHAGEGGIMGSEEQDEIKPAIWELNKENMLINGPIPADTIFLKAQRSRDTVVLAWYHDQALIPFKLLNFHSGVNVTLGLPYVRTSPDHGPAFDIAGRGICSAGSMLQAIKLADSLIS